ncbi:MAG: transcriptional repressor LexA [Elusimicrobia bacterium]|nr:transcriptional repressor LexA [Elusimicrobiota bacterium]
MPEPTALQRRILDYIAGSVEDRGFPPTLREIGAHCGISSTGSVSYHLQALESLGLLTRQERSSRAALPVESPYRLPIVGRVGAGSSVIAEEDVEGVLAVGKDVAHGAQYLLRVRGESMTGAGIMEGDLVQVRRQAEARDGELVVALVENDGLVKRLKRRASGWQLESAHPDYPPIAAGFQVIGKVVGLLRKY